mmetsp:Transcript_39260/g.127009  ORF Transcript_39260/g.127009 Transcript_39260/m.127009 type:complete len:161 (-) Transcript_39260:65-547(-)
MKSKAADQDSSPATPTESSCGSPSESESEVETKRKPRKENTCSLCSERGHKAYQTPRNGKQWIKEERYISCINHHMEGTIWTSKDPAPPIQGKGKGKGKVKGRGFREKAGKFIEPERLLFDLLGTVIFSGGGGHTHVRHTKVERYNVPSSFPLVFKMSVC